MQPSGHNRNLNQQGNSQQRRQNSEHAQMQIILQAAQNQLSQISSSNQLLVNSLNVLDNGLFRVQIETDQTQMSHNTS